MSMMKLIAGMVSYRLEDRKEITPYKTPNVPLNLAQGATVDINIAPFVLVEAAGGRFPTIETNQYVVGVSKFDLFGMTCYRSYLSDGRTFIQTVVPSTTKSSPKAKDQVDVLCNIYTLQRDEQGSPEEAFWDSLLNTKDGWIGLNFFGLPKVQANPAEDVVWYPRAWMAGDERINPVSFRETIYDISGSANWAKHETMLYGRALTTASNGVNEYVLPTVTETADGGAAFVIWIGIDINPSMLSVIAP